MPIYEFICKECHNRQEILLKIGETVPCPACGSAHFEKQISLFAIKTDSPKKPSFPNDLPSIKPQSGDTHACAKEKTEKSCAHSSCKASYVDSLIKKYDKSKGI